MAIDTCPACAAPVAATDHFCEACGQDLTGAPALPVRLPLAGQWVTSSGTPTTCPSCGGTSFGAEGYCDGCGQLRAVANDHSELDLELLAAVTDKGHRHHRNEDAVAIGTLADTMIGIVCDGVSSLTRPDAASHSAVDAAMSALLNALRPGPEAPATVPPGAIADVAADAIAIAARAGQAAASLAAGPEPGANPPASTFVCAVVEPAGITVGWVGDSRAYWLPDDPSAGGPECLTVDDSMAGQAAAKGVALPPGVPHSQTVALLRWLGADASDTVPHIRHLTPPGPGRILVCSDGLFRYRPVAAELAAATPAGRPLETAQALVKLALDAGGQDNIAVAVVPYPPTARPQPTSVRTEESP